MARLLVAIFCLAFAGGVTQAFAHGGEYRVELELDSASTLQAGSTMLIFQMVDTKNNTVITDADLNVVHEKKLHVAVYDEALEEFQHIHPEYKNGHWEVDASFAKNGKYWLWAQGELTTDKTEFSSPINLNVLGGLSQNPKPQLSDIRKGTSGNSVVTIDKKTITAGKMVMLDLVFSRNDGTKPVLTNYLGALVHVMSVPEDADALIHVHPIGSAPKLMLHATFPYKGFYRLWIEFIDGGTYKRIPLSVEVK